MGGAEIVGLVVIWFILGLGVFNMWRRLTDSDAAILIIPFWPLVLLVTAVVPRKD